jgi:hypothetical protein
MAIYLTVCCKEMSAARVLIKARCIVYIVLYDVVSCGRHETPIMEELLCVLNYRCGRFLSFRKFLVFSPNLDIHSISQTPLSRPTQLQCTPNTKSCSGLSERIHSRLVTSAGWTSACSGTSPIRRQIPDRFRCTCRQVSGPIRLPTRKCGMAGTPRRPCNRSCTTTWFGCAVASSSRRRLSCIGGQESTRSDSLFHMPLASRSQSSYARDSSEPGTIMFAVTRGLDRPVNAPVET